MRRTRAKFFKYLHYDPLSLACRVVTLILLRLRELKVQQIEKNPLQIKKTTSSV